jgi:mitogen-activated protein kinase 1/3
MRQLSNVPKNIFTTKLHDIILSGEADTFESIFLVMDYESEDLKTLLSTASLDFDEDHALIITYNILCALNFLHSAKVVHRDLKPQNILVNSKC